MTDLISIDEISKQNINNIFILADLIKSEKLNKNLIENKNIGIMFFEPSTRTMLSFETAINNLGGNYIKFNESESSIKKGETLYDTIKTMESYCDLLIIRHPEVGIMKKIKEYTKLPIINAGDGSGEHPTQALLDLFIIKENIKNFKSILFVGDNKNSRTVKSLIKLLERFFTNLNYYFFNVKGLEPENLRIKNFKIINNYQECIDKVDVVYMTRIQKERTNQDNFNYKNLIMKPEILNLMKRDSILMHPLPRNEEIEIGCDSNFRSKYFDQIKNGVYIRMALLIDLLNPNF